MSNMPSDSTHTITFKIKICHFPSLYVRSDGADITGAVLDQLKQQLYMMSFKKVHADRQRE